MNVVLEYRATQQLLADAKEKEALKKVEEQEKNKNEINITRYIFISSF